MAATPANEDKILLKVMVHKEEKGVLFAEADGNFIDILFSFMTFPMGTIVKLLAKCPDENFNALGSLTNLYQSLMDLPANYLSTDESKFMMLDHKSAAYDYCKKLQLKIDDTKPTRYFLCCELKCIKKYSVVSFSTCNFARCKDCGGLMDKEIEYKGSTDDIRVPSFGDSGVFVSNATTFLVSDDLRVMPNTSNSIHLLLCDFGITDARQLEERSVDIGHEEILKLVLSAISVKNPLTELVFPCMQNFGHSVDLRQEISVQHLCGKETEANETKMMLKVILQKSTSKFLYAEAEAEFVDFVFGFLDIPLGTLIGKLMDGSTCIGSLDNLYASISSMRMGKDIKSQQFKDMLLEPQLVKGGPLSKNQIFPLNVSNGSHATTDTISAIRRFNSYVTDGNRIKLQDPRINGSFLKASARFMLTNDLVITPFSSFFTIAFLNKLEIPVHDIEEHTVSIGLEEGLKILKASLVSRSTLSDALLNKKAPSQES